MLPGDGIGDVDKSCFTTNAEYKFKYGSEGLNTSEIKEYIRNPHKFNIKPEMDGKYLNLWSTDNDKTDANDDVVIKSVYDPSPVGYSLPASNAFTGFTTTGQNVGSTTTPATPEQINVKLPFDKGYYFYAMPNKTGNNYFFVASGWRFWDSGNMADTYKYGTCWTAGRTSGVQSYFLGFYSSFIYPKHVDNNSYGFAVRSAEEKETCQGKNN